MDLKVLLLFLWFCLVQSSVIQREYWYHPELETWEEAQKICNETYKGDLATVFTNDDLSDLSEPKFTVWIGQFKDGNKASSPGDYSDKIGKNGDKKACIKVEFPKKRESHEKCDKEHFVLCKDDNDQYHLSNETMTWSDGLNFCHENYKEYVTEVSDALSILNDFPAWIGLNLNDSNADIDQSSGLCAAVTTQSKTMLNKSCSDSLPFLCYQHNLVLLKETWTWEDAMETCRNLSQSFDLLSVEEHELQYVQSYAHEANTSKVWLGLRFLAGSWFWSDKVTKTIPSHSYFNSSCPEFHLGCGALVVNITSTSDPVIEATDCSEKLSVFCYDSSPEWD